MAILINEIKLPSDLTISNAVAVVTVASLRTSDEKDKIIGFVDVYASEVARANRKKPVIEHYYRFEFETEDRELSPIKQAYDYITTKATESVIVEKDNTSGVEFVNPIEHRLFGECIKLQ